MLTYQTIQTRNEKIFKLFNLRRKLADCGFNCNGYWKVMPSKWKEVDGKEGLLTQILELEKQLECVS